MQEGYFIREYSSHNYGHRRRLGVIAQRVRAESKVESEVR